MKSTYLYIGLVIIIVVGLVTIRNKSNESEVLATTPFDVFSQCLTDAGAKFYGAYWCPHCQEQKKMLKNSKRLPYIECSTPDGKGRTKECIDANIQGYPTWDFADGTRKDAVLSLKELSDITKCELPTT